MENDEQKDINDEAAASVITAKAWAEADISKYYSVVFSIGILTVGAIIIVLIMATHGAHFGS